MLGRAYQESAGYVGLSMGRETGIRGAYDGEGRTKGSVQAFHLQSRGEADEQKVNGYVRRRVKNSIYVFLQF